MSERGSRRTLIGTVVSNKMDKTVVVRVERCHLHQGREDFRALHQIGRLEQRLLLGGLERTAHGERTDQPLVGRLLHHVPVDVQAALLEVDPHRREQAIPVTPHR